MVLSDPVGPDAPTALGRRRPLVELIEAASRSGRNERAAEALEILAAPTSASGTPWALGVEARSRALLAHGDDAEKLYREAIDRLEPTRLRVDLARTRLPYGEWLRRDRRRLDAREQLRGAYDFFADAGMEASVPRMARSGSARAWRRKGPLTCCGYYPP